LFVGALHRGPQPLHMVVETHSKPTAGWFRWGMIGAVVPILNSIGESGREAIRGTISGRRAVTLRTFVLSRILYAPRRLGL
jgi:hypothetical protein